MRIWVLRLHEIASVVIITVFSKMMLYGTDKYLGA